ncbi:potassium channel family protein [Salinispira pacifica]
MKTIALIGLGEFNQQLIEELLLYRKIELILIDRDPDLVEQFKERVNRVFIADASSAQTLQKIIPEGLFAAVIDLGEQSDAAVLAVNHLRKMGAKRIIAKADSRGFAETLRRVGAAQVIEPQAEVARRIAPPLLLQSMKSYMQISPGIVVSEVDVPEELEGKTMITGDLRGAHRVNVVALRKAASSVYSFPDPAYEFVRGDALLVVGSKNDISKFAGAEISALGSIERAPFFRRLLGRGERNRSK